MTDSEHRDGQGPTSVPSGTPEAAGTTPKPKKKPKCLNPVPYTVWVVAQNHRYRSLPTAEKVLNDKFFLDQDDADRYLVFFGLTREFSVYRAQLTIIERDP